MERVVLLFNVFSKVLRHFIDFLSKQIQHFIHFISFYIPCRIQHMQPEQPKLLTENISKLLKLHSILDDSPSNPQPHIRQYISIYIEFHNRSDEYFTTFCEHDFLSLMISAEKGSKNTTETCLLECINLLLKNTKNQSELVYYLSQSCLHEYLFGFSLSSESAQFIQYYVQLLKTILLKLDDNECNKSLIKMFCNTKYPNFPLLSNCAILAIDDNELVRVTAQQCLLILVRMINEMKIMRGYLVQLPLLIFFYRLCSEYSEKNADKEGIIKYLADFSFQLRNNHLSLLLLNSIISNTIIVPSIPSQVALGLSFIYNFSNNLLLRIRESQLDKNTSDNLQLICLTHYRLFGKYLMNKYLNATYFSTILILSSIEKVQVDKIPFHKILQEYNCKEYIEDKNLQLDIDINTLASISIQIEDYNSGKEFQKLKESYLKKSLSKHNGIFTTLFKKFTGEHHVSQSIKILPFYFGISPFKGFIFPFNISMPTSAFICQYMDMMLKISQGFKIDNLKWNQESDDCQPMDIHFNDFRGGWKLTFPFLKILSLLLKELIQFIQEGENKIPKISAIYVPHYYPFLKQFKIYFNHSIHEHFFCEAKNKQLLANTQNLREMKKVCRRLKVTPIEKTFIRLSQELNILHEQIQACFFEKNFKNATEILLMKSGKSKSDKDNLIFRKILTFQTIQQIMNPHIPSLEIFVNKKWQEKKCKKEDQRQFMVTYFGINESILTFQECFKPFSIFIVVNVHGKTMAKLNVFDITQIKKNSVDNRVLHIEGSPEIIKMISDQEADQLIKRFGGCKEKIQEITTSAIIEYLSNSHEMLIKEGKPLKFESMSTIQTPR